MLSKDRPNILYIGYQPVHILSYSNNTYKTFKYIAYYLQYPEMLSQRCLQSIATTTTRSYCLPFTAIPPIMQISTFKYSPSSYCHVLVTTFLWQGIITMKRTKKHGRRPLKFYKNCSFVRYILWCHFNAMLIMEWSVKWLIWMLNNLKEKFKNKIKLGFGFYKRPLNLNNNCIKSNQFCKLLS